MTSTTVKMNAPEAGWLRGPRFDTFFILGTLTLAVISGLVVLWSPALFQLVLMIDLWFLGYHHVVSTYTRLCCDEQSFQENKFLIVYLPFIVLGAVVALAQGFGIWILTTIYLYWQWFHYTRQSWGIGQVYRRKENELITEDDRLLKAVFYMLPLWGILYRSWQSPDSFLFLAVWTLPVPRIAVDMVGTATVIVLAFWALGRMRMYRANSLPLAHTIYTVSHLTVFGAGYLLIENITIGWLVINIWHNAQYVLFVWIFNTKRFKGGVQKEAKLISHLSQVKNWPYYFGFCMVLTVLLYKGLSAAQGWLELVGLAPMIIIYQTINFHHYVVDSMIWKIRKPKIQKTLGLDNH
jgi:hypothetical protein